MSVVMLIGIVVNNAIALVDYFNLLMREHGMSVEQAVFEAGRLRLRPIMITTATTMLALMPLSFGIGDGGEIQVALARVVIGGLISSTLITIVLIPVIYVMVVEIKKQTIGLTSETATPVTEAYPSKTQVPTEKY